ncbi:MAG TPA: hypothetical protein VGO62_07515, partial [Myxococcota bacterium]
SLTAPDLYLFAGGSIIAIEGPAALSLRDKTPTVADLLAVAAGTTQINAITIYPTIELGIELRVGNRVGATLFTETLPTLGNAPTLGSYIDLGLVKFQTVGVEVSFCF